MLHRVGRQLVQDHSEPRDDTLVKRAWRAGYSDLLERKWLEYGIDQLLKIAGFSETEPKHLVGLEQGNKLRFELIELPFL